MRRFHAPGRVNLMGDHIDYMGGTVLPMAIDAGTDVRVHLREDDQVVARSTNFEEAGEVVIPVETDGPQEQWGWANYVAAVVYALRARGVPTPGFDVEVSGTIPHGAGLSSSASLQVAVVVALNALTGAGLGPRDIALVAQSAENTFMKVACGVMDQMAIVFGSQGHALLIDCDELSVEEVRMPDEVAVIVADTTHRRELVTSEYNDRRDRCERAQALLGRPLVGVSLQELPEVLDHMPADLVPVARHVITEQQRVWSFAQALRDQDTAQMGRLLRASHESLRDDFKVTGSALDALVEAAWSSTGVIGARMTGAGFGGCTVNLVHPEAVEDFVAQTAQRYERATSRRPRFYPVQAANGAGEVSR